MFCFILGGNVTLQNYLDHSSVGKHLMPVKRECGVNYLQNDASLDSYLQWNLSSNFLPQNQLFKLQTLNE